MMSYKVARALAVASALVLVGGGCTLPFKKNTPEPLPAEETMKIDKSGDTLSEQSDIILEAALDEALFEEEASGDVSSDASLFTEDEELNNLEKMYDENEL